MSEDKIKGEMVFNSSTDCEIFFNNEWVKIRHNEDKKMEAYINNEWIDIEDIGADNFVESCSHDKEISLKALKEYGK